MGILNAMRHEPLYGWFAYYHSDHSSGMLRCVSGSGFGLCSTVIMAQHRSSLHLFEKVLQNTSEHAHGSSKLSYGPCKYTHGLPHVVVFA